MSIRLSFSVFITNGPRPRNSAWIASPDTNNVPVVAPRWPNRKALHTRKGTGR